MSIKQENILCWHCIGHEHTLLGTLVRHNLNLYRFCFQQLHDLQQHQTNNQVTCLWQLTSWLRCRSVRVFCFCCHTKLSCLMRFNSRRNSAFSESSFGSLTTWTAVWVRRFASPAPLGPESGRRLVVSFVTLPLVVTRRSLLWLCELELSNKNQSLGTQQ